MAFGDKLRKIRRDNNLTQADMSQRLAMEQSNYSRYETNKTTPTIDLVNKIASEFAVEVDWLMQNDNSTVIFEGGSTNNGDVIQTENYYAVPKELIESWLQPQAQIAEMLQKIINK
jgi:transcriptional regulator with XRE-family HTH domain